MPHGKALTAAGFAKNANVHGAATIAQYKMPLRHLPIRYMESEIEGSAFFPHSSTALLQAVPDSRNEFFEKVDHEVIV
jgi:hypothetical protein